MQNTNKSSQAPTIPHNSALHALKQKRPVSSSGLQPRLRSQQNAFPINVTPYSLSVDRHSPYISQDVTELKPYAVMLNISSISKS